MGKCNHHCEVTYENMRPNMSHYLDCPVWQTILEFSNGR